MKKYKRENSDARLGASRRRRGAAVLLSLALFSVILAPQVKAQVPDVPSLGLEISPSQGEVGSTVQGVVNADDVAEHCITDPEEFVAQLAGPFSEATERYLVEVLEGDIGEFGSPSHAAMVIMSFVPLILQGDLGQAADGMRATFVFAFADLLTSEPIDPIGSFDPMTGEGSVVVPNVDPGTHPVIATCVAVPDELSNEDIAQAYQAGVAYIEANFEEPLPALGSDEFTEMGGEVFPVILRALVEPRALGIQFFCVDDGTGSCDKEETPDPTDPQTPPGEEGDGNGEPEGNGQGGPGSGGGGQAPGATPVTARPSYTG